jgi:tRNA-specific adenosine deaminase 1
MTGAKLLVPDGDDLMAQNKGCLRTKPGKGVRTLSLSCSDKLSKWNFMGIQGALLMTLLDRPIYLKSVTFSSGTDYSTEAVERAIWKRWNSEKIEDAIRMPFIFNRPLILSAENRPFRFAKNCVAGDILQPAACGTIWCDVVER